jgi:hypothetical protein
VSTIVARGQTSERNSVLLRGVVDTISAHVGSVGMSVLAERSSSTTSVVKSWGMRHPVCDFSGGSKVLSASTISSVVSFLSEHSVLPLDDGATVPLALVSRRGFHSSYVTESHVRGELGGGGRWRYSRIIPAPGRYGVSTSGLASDLEGPPCVHALFTSSCGKSILCPIEYVCSGSEFGSEYVVRALVYLGERCESLNSRKWNHLLLCGSFPPAISSLVREENTRIRLGKVVVCSDSDASTPRKRKSVAPCPAAPKKAKVAKRVSPEHAAHAAHPEHAAQQESAFAADYESALAALDAAVTRAADDLFLKRPADNDSKRKIGLRVSDLVRC